jgi:hypothetical protein
VHAGGSLVRLGRMAERLHRGGQHLYSGSVRLGRMVPGRFRPLAAGPAPNAARVSVPKLLKPCADRVKAGVDLLSAAGRGPGLTVHASQHVSAVVQNWLTTNPRS